MEWKSTNQASYISLEDWGFERSREHKVIIEVKWSQIAIKRGQKARPFKRRHSRVAARECVKYRIVLQSLKHSFAFIWFGPTPTCAYLLRTQQNTLLLRWFCWDCNQLVCLQRLSLDPISNLPIGIGDQTPCFPSKPTSCFLGFSDPNLCNTSSWLSWLPLIQYTIWFVHIIN